MTGCSGPGGVEGQGRQWRAAGAAGNSCQRHESIPTGAEGNRKKRASKKQALNQEYTPGGGAAFFPDNLPARCLELDRKFQICRIYPYLFRHGQGTHTGKQRIMTSSKRFISLSIKLAFYLSILPLVSIPVLTYLSTSTLIKEFEENAKRVGTTVTSNVAELGANAVMSGNFNFLTRALSDTINAQQEFLDGFVLKRDGEMFASYSRKSGEGAEGAKIADKRLSSLAKVDAKEQVVSLSYRVGSVRYMDFAKDIYNGDEKIATLVFGASLEALDEKIRQSWLNGGLLAAIVILIAVALGIVIARSITKPLKELVQEAATISSGNLDNEIQAHSGDEVGLLAHAFEQMRLSLKKQIAEIAKKALSLEGDLKVFSLPDLMQFICTANRTGYLVIDNNGEDARIYFRKGEIVHSMASGMVGKEAVFRLFNLTSGAFRFEAGDFEVEESIHLPWQHVIMEGARQTDEMNRVRQLIPSADLRIEVSEPPDGMSQVNLTPEELQISMIARNQNTVADILAASPLEEIDTYKVLYRLISTGLLDTVK